MRFDDERDPLDTWLSRDVRPLPPPPGTFELITRRARRRKIRKVAVTVASAVAVAAGVAVAVPSVMALHLSPGPTNGNQVAEGSAATPSGGTQSPQGTASQYPSPTPATSSPSGVPAEHAGPVPPDFQPSSVTFVNETHAWVIGQAGTPGHCADANPYYCTSVARTNNAGQTWEGGPAPKTGPPSGASGVSGIRFLDGVHGWAFGPELWSTHDAGNTWIRQDTSGMRVTDLETVHHRAYALWAMCSGTDRSGFAMNCTSYTLMTTPAGSDQWTEVGGATSGLTAQGNATSGFIALTGSVGYLVAPDGTLYSGPIGGAWTRAGTLPCEPGTPQASGLPSDAVFAAASPGHLAIACHGTAATSPPAVYTSANNGAFWTPQPPSAWSGVTDIGAITSLAATAQGTLMLATTQGLYHLAPGGTQWKQVAGPSGGFTYVGMTTATQGVAVPADMTLHEVWMTFTGGTTWSPAALIAPSP